MTRFNGIALGPASPLQSNGGRRRRFGPSEADIQIQLLDLLVGPIKREGRIPGAGMTTRFPELALIYAINPNKGGQNSAAARGIAKAMGALAGMPDIHLPVARSDWLSLYLELKRPGEKPSRLQFDTHAALREEGHCVAVCDGVQSALNEILTYLSLRALSTRERWLACSAKLPSDLENHRLSSRT